MSDDQRQSFARWQGRSITQLGFVNNLLIGLSAGTLTFLTHVAFKDQTELTCFDTWLMVLSAVSAFLSLAVGCVVAWNRLSSFRDTAQIARQREAGERTNIDELRESTKKRDKWTWRLLKIQTVVFAFGEVLLLVVAVRAFFS
jgi:hypothetical protein